MADIDRTWDQPDQLRDTNFSAPPASPDATGNRYGSQGFAAPGYAPGPPEAPGPQGAADSFTEPAIQQAYRQGQDDMRRKLTTPRMTGYRVACGIVWAFWTVVFFVGAIAAFASGSVGTGLLSLILAGLSAWYDFRIWTLKARRLTFFIIF